MTRAWQPGDVVRVRDWVRPEHYAGHIGVVDHVEDGWVYVQGAQSMGDDPAGFRCDELEAVA